ncbi:hypothetical protein EDD22DRAFT_972836 [Suillus occidentalis]|nr:hypothetical protein EDD22DRAFT_972836 [Suillus occidentalis]
MAINAATHVSPMPQMLCRSSGPSTTSTSTRLLLTEQHTPHTLRHLAITIPVMQATTNVRLRSNAPSPEFLRAGAPSPETRRSRAPWRPGDTSKSHTKIIIPSLLEHLATLKRKRRSSSSESSDDNSSDPRKRQRT